MLGQAIRAGAAPGQLLPPQVWRQASRPLVAALQQGGREQRPALAPEQRAELRRRTCLDDIALLEEVLGESFQDWRSTTGRGSFAERALRTRVSQAMEVIRSWAPSARAASK